MVSLQWGKLCAVPHGAGYTALSFKTVSKGYADRQPQRGYNKLSLHWGWSKLRRENMSENKAKLHGSWRLVSFEVEFQNSEERQYPFGANPNGFLVLTPDGRMMTLITAKERAPGDTDGQQATLFRSMASYTGRYRIEGEKFITNVDASWNEAWNGSEQERFYKIEKGRLEFMTAWAPHPLPDGPIMRGILRWKRAT